MRKKAFYLVIIICSLTMIGSARQQVYGCDNRKTTVINPPEKTVVDTKALIGMDRSPLDFFLGNS